MDGFKMAVFEKAIFKKMPSWKSGETP